MDLATLLICDLNTGDGLDALLTALTGNVRTP